MYRNIYLIDNTTKKVLQSHFSATTLEKIKEDILYWYDYYKHDTHNIHLRITSCQVIEENCVNISKWKNVQWTPLNDTDIFFFDEFIDKNGKFKRIPGLSKYIDNKKLWKEQHKHDKEKAKITYAKVKAKKKDEKTEALENAMIALSHDLDRMAWDMSCD